MSNGINQRQNEIFSLQCLAAQRQIYSEAKKVELWQFVLCVLLPLSLAISRFFINNSELSIVYLIVAIAIIVLDLSFIEKSNKNREIAAKIQELFDTTVYLMQWNAHSHGNKDILLPKIICGNSRYEKQNNNYDEFINWYPINYDELKLLDGIFQCQKTNIFWDDDLRKGYKIFVEILLIAVFIIFIVCFGIFGIFGANLEKIVSILILLVPIIKFLIVSICKLNKDINRLIKIKASIEHIENLNGRQRKGDLIALQKVIYEHRAKCFLVPDCIYNLRRNKQEGKIKRTAEIFVRFRGKKL